MSARSALHDARAEAAAMRADRDAILAALNVPEGVDPVQWARVAGSCASCVRRRGDGTLAGPGVELMREVELLRAPRPLPDGPGQWWGSWGSGPVQAWDVEGGGRGLVVCNKRHPSYSCWSAVDDDEWTWLAGPDGRAVRCTPPEVTRG